MENEDDNCVCGTAFFRGVNSWSFVDRDIYGVPPHRRVMSLCTFRSTFSTDHI